MQKNPYKARVNARSFLNLPGFHDGAYVMAYVEDTSERGLEKDEYSKKPYNPRPRIILEIADCSENINLEFDVNSDLQVLNSLHKVDELLSALSEFREGLVEEADEYKRREKKLKKKLKKKGKKNG